MLPFYTHQKKFIGSVTKMIYLPFKNGTDAASCLMAIRHHIRIRMKTKINAPIRRYPRHFRSRRRGFAVEELQHIMDTDNDLFHKMFRLSVNSFCDLVESLDLALARDEAKAVASSGKFLKMYLTDFIYSFSLWLQGVLFLQPFVWQ